MKNSLLLLIALVAVMAVAGSAYSQVPVRDEPISPPDANWAGTTDIFWKFADNNPTVQIYPKRVGILAYCTDLYHNAGDVGLQRGDLDFNVLNPPKPTHRRNFDYLGQYGAQNVVDYFGYDDTIDRLRDAQIIDGDVVLPTATQLIRNFDIVIAYTDNKCGQPIPADIATSAGNALAGFVASPGKKLILTGFAFSSTIGFGDAIFAAGLSPLTKGGPALAPCRRAAVGTPCQIGSCATLTGPDGLPCTPQQPAPGDPAECRDSTNTVTCGLPTYQPLPAGGDQACSEFLKNVNGPTSSSWATALKPNNVARGATLCFNYDTGAPPGQQIPFLAINAARNIIAINSFPPDRDDIQKFWYGCMLGNALQYFSGDTNRCGGRLNCH